MGELAQMFKDELKLELDLQVIRCENWQREDYQATGLIGSTLPQTCVA
ncbi:MAG: DUF1343 domain-containing protein [Pirellulaceae bacterium]